MKEEENVFYTTYQNVQKLAQDCQDIMVCIMTSMSDIFLLKDMIENNLDENTKNYYLECIEDYDNWFFGKDNTQENVEYALECLDEFMEFLDDYIERAKNNELNFLEVMKVLKHYKDLKKWEDLMEQNVEALNDFLDEINLAIINMASSLKDAGLDVDIDFNDFDPEPNGEA